MKKFEVKSKEDELDLILSDDPDFSDTKQYLSDLINQAIDKGTFSQAKAKLVRKKLDRLVKTAAERFLDDKKCLEKDYKFSTYFTWYISQIINQRKNR